MGTVSTIHSNTNIPGITAAKTHQNTTGIASASDASASSNVTISNNARVVAANDTGGYKLPDYITAWFNKDFPQDIIDEAKARIADSKANGSLGAHGPMNLPLLPENQALQDNFRQEMKAIHDSGFENATPEQQARYNLLMNLSMRLQMVGWEKPMTEADVQKEFDIANVMGKLTANDPLPEPSANADKEIAQNIIDMETGRVPASWRNKWEKEGLTMPENITLSLDRSMWVSLGEAAGISQDELLSKLREMATTMKGNVLTQALESYISERYVTLAGSQQAPATQAA